VRHGPHAQLLVAVLEVHLVVPLQLAGLHAAHGLDREIEDHGLLDPFVHLPPALFGVGGFGGAEFAPVYEADHLADGLLHGGFGEQLAVLPRLPDYGLEFVVHVSLRF